MPTAAQLAKRQNSIGSSDVPVLFDLSPYKTKYDLWLEKTGRLMPVVETPAMRWGRLLEPVLLGMIREDYGSLKSNQARRAPSSHLLAHIDAIIDANKEPVEGKSSCVESIAGPEWGEFGTDDVPASVLLQSTSHMVAMRPEQPMICYVPVFLGGRGFGFYHVKFSQLIADAILEAVESFWVDHVQADTPPDNYQPNLEVMRRIKRQPNSTGNVSEGALIIWQDANAKAIQAKKDADAMKALLIREMDQNEAAFVGETGEALTYYEHERAAFVTPATTYRVLKHRRNGF